MEEKPLQIELKTMGRRPKSDINMDGSIGEDFTSLERMAAMDV